MVFWDGLLRQLDAHDAETGRLVREHAYTWTDQVVMVDGREPVRIPSFGYSMRRRLLLELLRARAETVGVQIEAGRVTDAEAVAAGRRPGHRQRRGQQHPAASSRQASAPRLSRLRNKYIWLGSDREFDVLHLPFVPTHAGWVWGHAYGFDEGASTFVVEMAPETWAGLGFDRMGPEATMAELEQLFAASLEGHRLFPPVGTRDRTPWTEFVVVRNRRWHVGNLALMGDAAHTTHYTIGSGTRLAMEDAMTLSTALAAEPRCTPRWRCTRRPGNASCRMSSARPCAAPAGTSTCRATSVRSEVDFATMMDDRRSPVMAHLPVGVYLEADPHGQQGARRR